MNFETTALFGECKRILESTSDPSLFFYRMEICTPYGTHNPAKLLSIDINSDYVRQYAPKIIATFMISYGEFTHRIRPYYQDLTVTITKSPDQLYRGPVGIDMQRYRAILVAVAAGVTAIGVAGLMYYGYRNWGWFADEPSAAAEDMYTAAEVEGMIKEAMAIMIAQNATAAAATAPAVPVAPVATPAAPVAAPAPAVAPVATA